MPNSWYPDGNRGASREPTDYARAVYDEAIARGHGDKAACHAALAMEQREYQERVQFWIQRLSRIALSEPPAPFVLNDGRTMTYIGPLAPPIAPLPPARKRPERD